MSQRSLHAVMKGNYRSMSCFATVSRQMAPLAVLWYPTQSGPFCTMWFRQFTQNVTKIDHKDRSHPHSTEHDTQPIAHLISKQTVPYRTSGGTCCPGCLLLRFGPEQIRAWQATSPDRIQLSPPFHPCSNHSIDPHHNQITSRWMGDHFSQSHKPNLTSQRMERFVWHSWLHD
jgi:hypothetical protein